MTALSEVRLIGTRGSSPPAPPEAVGAKAHGLMRLDALGVPVPPAFVLGTDLGRATLERGTLPDEGRFQLVAGVRQLEAATGRMFGSARRPLLVSVRSGAPVSMPGMMDTVLDVGVNELSVQGLIRATGNPRLAWDCHRRLVEGFATTVRGLDPGPFEELTRRRLRADGLGSERDLDAAALRELVRVMLRTYADLAGEPFPQDPMAQLEAAVAAVFRSYASTRATAYRALHQIECPPGSAALVQAMVFGNAGPASGTGVGFTRDPATGRPGLYVDFLFGGQGEDLVSGRVAAREALRLAAALPAVMRQVERLPSLLERAFGDVQEFEFTVEEGKLWVLQTRRAKRTPWAALESAVGLVRDGVIDPATALARLEGLDLDRIERVALEVPPGAAPLATGVPAGVGAAVGTAVFDTARAQELARDGQSVVLVRPALSTEDLPAIAVSSGVVAAAGGRTSHAAVVARELGKACLVDCRVLVVDAPGRCCRVGETVLREGDAVSLDASTGQVFAGSLSVTRERPLASLQEIERWRRLRAG
ncbi:MAG TPA: PEP/pyruvate-binding domain-containing protein [Anaeromyxobacteraceae bacterium]|nr:PEP/pyruvate-binding domain-containing protein [Anaeromyxobacteraceae bacterium]